MFYYYYHFLKLLSLLFQAKWWMFSRERDREVWWRNPWKWVENGFKNGRILYLCTLQSTNKWQFCYESGASGTPRVLFKVPHMWLFSHPYLFPKNRTLLLQTGLLPHIRTKVLSFKKFESKSFYISDFYLKRWF